jgi:chromosome segregation ATPase
MTTIDDDHRDELSADDPTGEFAMLDEALHEPHVNGTAAQVAAVGPESDDGRAAFWLAHMETEINRLRAKWDQIDADFKAKDARVVELREEIRARDAAVEALTAKLQQNAAAIESLEERLSERQAQMTALAADGEVRAAEAQQTVAALAAAEEQRRALQRELEAARGEIARLHAAVEREQAAAAEIAQRNDELMAAQVVLQGKVQDLEIYINGRHKSWSDLNAQIADYKDTLVGMGKTLKSKDVAIERQEEEKRALASRILELERQSSELVGRRKEREAAYEELQKKLTDHIEATEQLKVDFAQRAKETEQALTKAVNDRKLVESLERGIARRDENLADLEADLEKERVAAGELASTKDELTKRVDDLESGIQERAEQVRALRDELRSSNEQLRVLQQTASERHAELARSREIADENERLADELGEELRALKQDYSEQQDGLAGAQQRLTELEGLRETAEGEIDGLKAELAVQQELIGSLETELRAKQATLDLLQRNVHRITDLGASLAALDRRMSADADTPASAELDADSHEDLAMFPDFVSTVASGEARDDADAAELLPIEIFMGEQNADDLIDIGAPSPIDGERKLVAMMGGEGIAYPLRKPEMTIGRGKRSDIRIPSHFISRVHAKISTQGIATVIEDAGSKNGILVNSERVKRCILRDGDIVSLGGELDLRFVDAGR